MSLWGAACAALRIEPDADVIPLLPDLWSLKAGMGPDDGLARRVPEDTAGCVARFLRTVYGYNGSSRQIAWRQGSLVPVEWMGLLQYAGSRDVQPGSHLAALARVARWVRPGVDLTRELPTSKELRDAAEQLPSPVKPGTMNCALASYRRLRAAAVEANPANAERYPVLPDRRQSRGRGLLSVLARSADVADRSLGEAGDLRAAIHVLAPALYQQLIELEANPRGQRGKLLSVGYVDEMWDTVGHIVATLYVHRPALLPTCEIDTLWTTTVTVTAAAAGVSARNEKYLPREAGGTSDEVTMSLARWLVDLMAAASRKITGVTDGYSASLVGDVTQWWTLTEVYHGADLRMVNPELWGQWELAYGSLKKHLRTNPVPEDEVAKKASLARMELVSLPHLWCVGLPLLGREAERLLDRLEALRLAAIRAGYADPMQAQSVREARDAFAAASEPYLMTAVVWIDTMRCAQYLHGRWGLDFVGDRNASGQMIALHCCWDGKRLNRARIKQGSTGRRAYGPGLLNLRVLDGYVTYVRAPRLVRLGASLADAIASNGRWPLFVSSDARSLELCSLSESSFRRDRLGVTLYRVATEVLGHELGPYAQMNRAKDWKGAWAPHEVRKDVATIVGRLLGMWDRACAMTMDTQETLAQKYDVRGYYPVGEVGEWRCVETYYPHVRALLEDPRRAPCPLDDPDLPLPPGARAILDRWAEEDRTLKPRASRSTHGVAEARLRRPRPDVTVRNRARELSQKSQHDA